MVEQVVCHSPVPAHLHPVVDLQQALDHLMLACRKAPAPVVLRLPVAVAESAMLAVALK